MRSQAKTVDEYIAHLPAERAPVIQAIRAVISKNLPKGFREEMNYGMIGYVVPHKVYPPGYHASPDLPLPLPFMHLASQKTHIAVYHMGLHGRLLEWFKKEWKQHSIKTSNRTGQRNSIISRPKKS